MRVFLADPKVTYQVYLTSALKKTENKTNQTKEHNFCNFNSFAKL